MHSYVHACICLWALPFFDEICICNTFNDDMMCLLHLSLLWFNDTCAALFKMICYVMSWLDQCLDEVTCMLDVW